MKSLLSHKLAFTSILLVSALLSTTIGYTQYTPKSTIDAQMVKKEPAVKVSERFKVNEKTKFSRSAIKPKLTRSRAGKTESVKQHKDQAQSYKLKSTSNIAAVPELLLGSFKCKGISYWGGYIVGNVVITADKTESNKIWFENLIPGYSTQKVYGLLGSDQVTISIPQGQPILIDSLGTAKLSVHESTAPITGKFNASLGTITISTNYWGAAANDGWAELFEGEVTYTRLDMLPPAATYRQPKGALFLGMLPETWDGYTTSCILSSPYSTWNWKNTGLKDSVDYLWKYNELINGYSYSSTQDSLIMDVEDAYYDTPLLRATNKKGFSSSYILGANFKNKKYKSLSTAGGDAVWLGFDEKSDYSCANFDNGFTLLSAGTDSYYFGTGASKFSENDYESLIVYYEKPQTPIYFEGVNVYLFVFNAPENTKFTLNVFEAEKNTEGYSKKGSLIASANLLAKEVIPIKYGTEVAGYTMVFNNFQVKDEDGFLIDKEHFVMEDDFYLELTGVNQTGVKLAVATEEIAPTDGDSRSLFTLKNDSSIYFWEDHMQTMYFNLSGAAFSYITLSQNTVYDNRNGGSYNIEAFPYFDTLYIADQEIPYWLKVQVVSEEYNSEKWAAKIKVTIDALAATDSARYYNLVLKTTGAAKTLRINQGGKVSTKVFDSIQKTKIAMDSEGYRIAYPKQYDQLKIVLLNGSVWRTYKLPTNGNFKLNRAELPQGLSILVLSGKNNVNETFKVMR